MLRKQRFSRFIFNSKLFIRHLHKRGNREQGTLNWEQGRIIDNFWIRIDFIFSLITLTVKQSNVLPGEWLKLGVS